MVGIWGSSSPREGRFGTESLQVGGTSLRDRVPYERPYERSLQASLFLTSKKEQTV